jgi:hypothetical protein
MKKHKEEYEIFMRNEKGTSGEGLQEKRVFPA